jgi:hypothetical protein
MTERHRHLLDSKANLEELFATVTSKDGILLGAAKFVELIGGRISTVLPQETIQSIQKDPCIIVATHESALDILALFATLGQSDIQRDDLKLVAGAKALETPGISNYVLPLYNYEPVKPERVMVAIRYLFSPPVYIDDDKAKRLNASTLICAAKHVREGGVLTVCPDGAGTRRYTQWQEGIGSLLHLIERKSPDVDPNIIFADIENIGLLDRFGLTVSHKHFPPFTHGAKVHFSQPLPLSTLEGKTKDREMLTRDIQSLYRQWVNLHK